MTLALTAGRVRRPNYRNRRRWQEAAALIDLQRQVDATKLPVDFIPEP